MNNSAVAVSSAVKAAIKGSVCLVTGAGGSIGSTLIRQIMQCDPKTVVALDICENGIYSLWQELKAQYGDRLPMQIEIASVRDALKMEAVFEKYRPELVFHAAAHKHVPLMEYCPEEAVKNNVCGTLNTAAAAEKNKSRMFLLVSTDKAVYPSSVMGATKKCCEMIMREFADRSNETEFVTVRMGNVLGSNGSVIPLFESRIRSKAPIEVTHPDAERYFISVDHAARMILESAATMGGGKLFVPEMGRPVKIAELAARLIRAHGYEPNRDIEIRLTGLREGEKLTELLHTEEEQPRLCESGELFVSELTKNPEGFGEILRQLIGAAEKNDGSAVLAQLRKLCPTLPE